MSLRSGSHLGPTLDSRSMALARLRVAAAAAFAAAAAAAGATITAGRPFAASAAPREGNDEKSLVTKTTTTDVLIVGGGIAGAAFAMHTARAAARASRSSPSPSFSVTVIDRGYVGSEATGLSAGTMWRGGVGNGTAADTGRVGAFLCEGSWRILSRLSEGDGCLGSFRDDDDDEEEQEEEQEKEKEQEKEEQQDDARPGYDIELIQSGA